MAFKREETVSKVVKIIEEKLNIPVGTVTMNATFEDLGADSLDIVELIMSFEEDFGVVIKDEDADKIQTVEEVVTHIHEMRTK